MMLAGAADDKEAKDSGATLDADDGPKIDALGAGSTELESKDNETLAKREEAEAASTINEAVPENSEAVLSIDEDMAIASPDVTAGRNMDMLESFMSDGMHGTGKLCDVNHLQPPCDSTKS